MQLSVNASSGLRLAKGCRFLLLEQLGFLKLCYPPLLEIFDLPIQLALALI
jgi:hypothetical protein